jgi:hypothetical protein
VEWQFSDAAEELMAERYAVTKDPTRLAAAQNRIRRIERLTGKSSEDALLRAERPYLDVVREDLLKEYAKPKPDQKRIDALNKRFIELDALDRGQEHAVTRAEILKVLSEEDVLTGQAWAANRAGDEKKEAELEAQVAKLEQKERALHLRMGDPEILVDAPANAREVLAQMPNGEIKELAYNPIKKRWEGKFDVPAYATEREYTIRITIMLSDGTLQHSSMRYTVDLTPPKGTGKAVITSGANRKLRLEIDADPDTARVVALTPWNDRIELKPSVQPNRFIEILPLPEGDWANSTLTIILTDKAHNRNTLTLKAEAER